ncbi:MAG: hypothetical protein OXC96_06980 [Cyanobacteria bacterium MAG CAR1_bin_15]|nr:hypothetical protein [Cyanobacteria bacterium MAG CAR1_bin_15]
MQTSNQTTRQFVDSLHVELTNLFSDAQSDISAREDSRAFGALIEQKIATHWESICMKMEGESVPRPGRRTIYDFGVLYNRKLFGVDVKTKDLDSERYSDGGVCSVDNLLKFLVNNNAVFIVVEVGHNKSSLKSQLRDLSYIKVAPFHLLPKDAYRIENLGTGQVRLNYDISQIYDKIEWNRNLEEFLDIFVEIAISHYENVSQKSQERINKMRRFQNEGYKTFVS